MKNDIYENMEKFKKAVDEFLKQLSPKQREELDKLLSRISTKENIRITKSTKHIHCPCCGHKIQIHIKDEKMSTTKITFTKRRCPSENDYIVIWGGDVTEKDLYQIMKDHDLKDLSHCEIGLRNDDNTRPSLTIKNNDKALIPYSICCFNECSCDLTISPKEIRQDRYRSIYYFADYAPKINIIH